MGAVQRKGEQVRELPPLAWHEARGQGRDSAHELPGVASDLLWRPEGGLYGRAAELPLHGRRDKVLP